MPKTAAKKPEPTISPEILERHPLRLTRQSDAPVASGTYTLAQLRDTFGVEGDEGAVLKALASKGHAFFRQGDEYTSFDPRLGDIDLPINADPLAVNPVSLADADAAKEAIFPQTPEAIAASALAEVDTNEPIVTLVDLKAEAESSDSLQGIIDPNELPDFNTDSEDGEDGDGADDLTF